MIYAATGHREIHDIDMCSKIVSEYLQANRPEVMIIGCAKGFDTRIGHDCLNLDIPFDMYLPFVGSYYDPLLKRYARKFIIVSEGGYSKTKYWLRDKKMVDDANKVIAWYDGRQAGGTYITQKYAKDINKPVHNLYSKG